MLISGHKSDSDTRYTHSHVHCATNTKIQIISVGFLYVCVCALGSLCIIVIKMNPNVRYWTTISWKGDGFCLRLLFYYLVVHTTQHFYLFVVCTMNAFHHISFHFFSFHLIPFVFCHSLGNILIRVQLILLCAHCTMFKWVSFHDLNAQHCCCIYFDSKIKVSASGLQCSIALYAQQSQAANGMVIFV